MTFIKVIGNYMILFEIKKVTPDFPDIKTSKAPDEWWHKAGKRALADLRKEKAVFKDKYRDIIEKWEGFSK